MKILYLENHEVFAKQVTSEFLFLHEVTIVPTLADARRVGATHCFDLILSDFDLDDGKGDEFVRDCRASYPNIPVIAVSSHQEGNDALVAAGATAVCSKMQFDQIAEVIEKVLSRAG